MVDTAGNYDYLRKLLAERSAIVLDADKGYFVEARLAPIVQSEKLGTVANLLSKLRAQPYNGLHQCVVEAMTTNESSFFRDVHPFDALRTVVLPELLKRRAQERRLAIWSAAASSGQEVYTIAMLLKEHFPQLGSWKVHLLATDLSRPMVARTREGVFSQLEVNRGLPAAYLAKYFRQDGPRWIVAEDLRRNIDARVMNLAESWPALPAMDIVFLRNVLIYFSVETKKEVLRRLRSVLRSEGLLFLGGAETTLGIDEGFERVPMGKAVAYRLRR